MYDVECIGRFGLPSQCVDFRKFICEVCKIHCDMLDVLAIHRTRQKHKKNMKKFQHSITHSTSQLSINSAIGLGVLEDKKKQMLNADTAEVDMKICIDCNIVMNSQKVYEQHLAGQKHLAIVQKKLQAEGKSLLRSHHA